MAGKQRRWRGRSLAVISFALGMVLLAASETQAQHRWFRWSRGDECPPEYPPAALRPPSELGKPLAMPARPEMAPTPSSVPAPSSTPAPAPSPTTEAAPPLSFEGGPAVRGSTFAFATPNLQGDQLSVPATAFGPRGNPRFPPPPGQQPGGVLVPSIRSFKIAENDSPFPRDRVYFSFNYFDEVNQAVNRRTGSDLENLRVFRETFGLEKTFFDGDLSLGFRLPLNSLHADSRVPGLAGNETAVGDLSLILKAAVWGDRRAGRILTTGLAVTVPTGPDRFAGFPNITAPPHSTILQPFVGGVCTLGDFFVHGYTALDVPTTGEDVTMWYNDVGIGYFLYRDGQGQRFVSAITPTFEVHINTPLNHRGALNRADPAGTPDVIALTTGVTVELSGKATVALGVVTPVTGPKPFNWEMLAQVNVRFGPGGFRFWE